jgi:membrane dipeptidase
MTTVSLSCEPTRRRFLKTAAALSVLGVSGDFRSRASAAVADAPLSPSNETIQKAREAALAVLKPSPKDLEHGFDLHAHSLVFESYGFAPRAAPDGDLIRQALEAGASDAELSDLAEELPMIRVATEERERKEFLEAFRAAGVTCIFQNAGEESNDPLRLIKRLARFTYATDLLRNELGKAASPDDIVAAKKEHRLCLYFTGNGVPLRQQWNSVRDELGFIRVFQQLGIRMMHLRHRTRRHRHRLCLRIAPGSRGARQNPQTARGPAPPAALGSALARRLAGRPGRPEPGVD